MENVNPYEDGLNGDEDTAEIPQEVLDAVNSIKPSSVVADTRLPTPEVIEAHAKNLEESVGKEFKPNVDERGTRVYSVNDYIVYRDKTYGMWNVKAKEGSLPASLKSTYTSLDKANIEISTYVNKMNLKNKAA